MTGWLGFPSLLMPASVYTFLLGAVLTDLIPLFSGSSLLQVEFLESDVCIMVLTRSPGHRLEAWLGPCIPSTSLFPRC